MIPATKNIDAAPTSSLYDKRDSFSSHAVRSKPRASLRDPGPTLLIYSLIAISQILKLEITFTGVNLHKLIPRSGPFKGLEWHISRNLEENRKFSSKCLDISK
jgi:hypothetical protein